MIVHYVNADNKRTLVAAPSTDRQMWKCIDNFLSDIGIKPRYYRIIQHQKSMIVDFGSHTEFFHVTLDQL